eukprot:4627312-Prymnesium_polylepis.1
MRCQSSRSGSAWGAGCRTHGKGLRSPLRGNSLDEATGVSLINLWSCQHAGAARAVGGTSDQGGEAPRERPVSADMTGLQSWRYLAYIWRESA